MQKHSSYAAQNAICILPYEVLMIKPSKIKWKCSKTWFSENQGPPCIISMTDMLWYILNSAVMKFELFDSSFSCYWYPKQWLKALENLFWTKPGLYSGIKRSVPISGIMIYTDSALNCIRKSVSAVKYIEMCINDLCWQIW